MLLIAIQSKPARGEFAEILNVSPFKRLWRLRFLLLILTGENNWRGKRERERGMERERERKSNIIQTMFTFGLGQYNMIIGG